ncbi:dethiobiotin synthase [Paenibacillus glycanilyticus]|uniref:dethiobiotin synthase n=1 Tax=Paenibacillus glycanilyticus TaxID=126569 RepID=UPI002040541F|nr:dethiobiotin synthase [Paenibacillus glycanilyticus]MCM3628208.1 dethiobiotin synthase [Paenibacillus glycanilyticus]
MNQAIAKTNLSGLFVTGTDTGVGKTIVAAAIAASLRAEGLNIGVWKPVQSGEKIGSGLTDAERLLHLAGIEDRPEVVAPFTFEAPVTPMLAAKQSGVTLTLKGLINAGAPLIDRYQALIVEGAGGVAVPLTEDALVADFISELRMPALIVARSGLGTINHTLLTASYLKQLGIDIIGVIMNDIESAEAIDDPSIATNAELIEQYGGLKVLGRLTHVHNEMDSETLIPIFRERIELAPIRDALAVQIMGG